MKKIDVEALPNLSVTRIAMNRISRLKNMVPSRLSRTGAMLSATALFVIPTLVFAQEDAFDTAIDASGDLVEIFNILVRVAFAAILLAFFWGLAKYIWGGADEKSNGKSLMIWGVVALAVAASIWGIVMVLRITFGIGDDTNVLIPFAT